MKVLLDPADYAALQQQRNNPLHDGPLRFQALIDRWAVERTGRGVSRADLRSLLDQDAVLLSWLPTKSAITAAVTGRLVYLYWGYDLNRPFNGFIVKSIIRRAQAVIVNDPTSETEVINVRRHKPITAPMFIDADYFCAAPPGSRGRTLFCPGSIDRDFGILIAMANAGLDVVWLCNDPLKAKGASQASPRLQIVSNISFEELRNYYRTCAAVITPTHQDIHAAGQTTALEALSSAAPVLLSRGRTALLLERFPSVRVIQGGSDAWISAAKEILTAPPSYDILLAAADEAAAHVAPDAVMSALDKAFASAGY